MAKLTAAKRKKLPSKDFAFPKKRSYPIEDKAHARAALSRGKHDLPKRKYITLARKVKRKYPTMHVKALEGKR